MLRYKADLKTILYIIIISSLMMLLLMGHQNLSPTFRITLFILEMVMSISAGVMVHNHRHVPIWKNKHLNIITDCWLTILYGYPVFGWIPTHLQNHHTYTNKEEDYTKTYAFSEKNNLFNIIYYPMYSGGVQQKAIWKYLKSVYKKDLKLFAEYMLQVLILLIFILGALLIDWKATLLYVILPQQIGLNSVLVFNYIQHIHADEMSEYDHSRNIEGFLNIFLFNNGLHTAHHLKPYLHWSKLPEYHAEIRNKIDPNLIENNLIWYLIRQYILSPFYKKWATKPMRVHTRES